MLKNIGLADLIISISENDSNTFNDHFPDKNHILVPIGQDLNKFINYPKNDDGKTILFYGSMGGQQNIIGFWRLYKKILPLIRNKIQDVKLIVLGANPPEEIKKLHNGNSIIVTDFVEDVREYISRSTIKILPLETSGGFRSRIVEVMALGVTIIGTNNALGGYGIRNNENGFIIEHNSDIANKAVELMQNPKQLKELSKYAKELIITKYSINQTYGKLSNLYEKNY